MYSIAIALGVVAVIIVVVWTKAKNTAEKIKIAAEASTLAEKAKSEIEAKLK